METLPAVVVGCGAIGSGYDEPRAAEPPLTHAGSYVAHDRTQLVAGVDPDPEARLRFEKRWGVAAYAELDQALVDVRPKLFSICTPADARADVVGRALEAGAAAIWAEKPLAPTADAATEIVAACDRAGVPLQVNFLRRFDDLHRRVATLVGRQFHADFRFSGSFANYGAHAFDLFRWYAGETSWAQAELLQDGEPLVLLESMEGATGSFYRVRDGDADMFECDFYTARGRFTLGGLGERLVRWEPTASALFHDVVSLGAPVVDPTPGLRSAMIGGVDSLVACLDSGDPPLCDGRDGLAALRIEEAAREAARMRTRVTVRCS